MVHDNETIDPEGFLLTSKTVLPANFTGKIKYPNGSKYWYKNGKLNREDGPAIEIHSGHREWYKNGQPHREEGPAVTWPDGTVEWWYEGVRGLENFPPELKKKLTRKFLIEI